MNDFYLSSGAGLAAAAVGGGIAYYFEDSLMATKERRIATAVLLGVLTGGFVYNKVSS